MAADATETSGRPADRAAGKLVGILCALIVVALFSGLTLVSRLGRSADLTPFDLAALRFGIGGVILLPVFLRHGLSGLPWRGALTIACLGGLGFAAFAYTGLFLAPAAHGAVLLHGTLPLFTVLIVKMIDPAQSRPRAVPGIVLIGLGIAMMAWDSLRDASRAQLAGDGLLLLAALCWSAYGVAIRKLAVAPIRAAAIVAVISMISFLPPYLALRGDALLALEARDLIVQGLFQGVLLGAVSIFVYTQSVAILGASETALFTAAVPAVTTLGAIPLLSEWASISAWTGVAIATAGMLVAIRGTMERRKRT